MHNCNHLTNIAIHYSTYCSTSEIIHHMFVNTNDVNTFGGVEADDRDISTSYSSIRAAIYHSTWCFDMGSRDLVDGMLMSIIVVGNWSI